MQVNVDFLENLKLEARFDDFKIMTDQPVRYKGDGMAPSPFDYFLASSALCAAYFVKIYCNARGIPTEGIKLTQNNTLDPENRYHQDFNIQIELPENLSEKDREGILRSMDRCTVKRVIQNSPKFKIEAIDLDQDSGLIYEQTTQAGSKTTILGKDRPLEETIQHMSALLENLGIKIEIASWRNPVPYVWSVHIRDADSPMCYTNGKGSSKEAALCSALGEYLERISTNYFYSDYYLGKDFQKDFVHYPQEKWFEAQNVDQFPVGLMDSTLLSHYDNDGELKPSHLIDTNSGQRDRGVCALPFTRASDNETVYIPVNLIANLFASNGMSAGNTKFEARVQCLSEIFERAIKHQIITEEITLPNVPEEILKKYPKILEGLEQLQAKGFPLLVKDASLGGQFPVMCVTLMNPRTGGVYASFGAHPKFEVALERSLTELLQGRSFEGLNEMPAPTFNEFAINEQNNIVDHFIDSTGVVSWKFFSSQSDYEFFEWNIEGGTEEEYQSLMQILKYLGKEVYIADYNDLGAPACRILVPDFSEIYPPEDLVWDNHNRSLDFREDILNIHSLTKTQLKKLIENLEESELDDYMPISELIGVSFDEASVWGQLVIGELKCLSYLALNNLEVAKNLSEMLLTFNDNTPKRRQFFQLLDVVLEIELNPELALENYKQSLHRMYGKELLEDVIQSVKGELKFYGLTKTDSNLKNLDKHLRLIESYKKLHKARKAFTLNENPAADQNS